MDNMRLLEEINNDPYRYGDRAQLYDRPGSSGVGGAMPSGDRVRPVGQGGKPVAEPRCANPTLVAIVLLLALALVCYALFGAGV